METKFQTSFIPKKPMSPSMGGSSIGATAPVHHGVTSVFMSIAVIIFILSLGVLGGSYFLKSYLLSQQDNYKSQLVTKEGQFNTNTMEDLKRQNIRIDISKQLLKEHLAISQIFDIIGRFTTEKVRFLSMDLTTPANTNDDIKISLSGYGTNYLSVAWQSDVLGQLEAYGLKNIVKNPIISNPSEDPDATVSFGFSASIDPKSLSYEKSFTTEASSPSTSSGTDQQNNPNTNI